MQETQVQSLGWEDPLEEELANPLQYSCLKNPTDRGAWRAAVHGVAKELDTTEQLSIYIRLYVTCTFHRNTEICFNFHGFQPLTFLFCEWDRQSHGS